MWYYSLGRLFVDRLNEHDVSGVEELLAAPCNLHDYAPEVREGFDNFFTKLDGVHHNARHFNLPKHKRANCVVIDYERSWRDAQGRMVRTVAADSLTFDQQGLIPTVAYERKPVLQSERGTSRAPGGISSRGLLCANE